MSKQMPPKVISGGDNPYDIHDAKLSSSATAHESSSVTAHEISNNYSNVVKSRRGSVESIRVCLFNDAFKRIQTVAGHEIKKTRKRRIYVISGL